MYNHSRDPTWDVNDYLIDLKRDLLKWRDVYWRVWDTVNYLLCSRCGEVFPCCELGHCRYHIEQADFEGGARGVLGQWPCCGQKMLRFDPTQPNRVSSCHFAWLCQDIVAIEVWFFDWLKLEGHIRGVLGHLMGQLPWSCGLKILQFDWTELSRVSLKAVSGEYRACGPAVGWRLRFDPTQPYRASLRTGPGVYWASGNVFGADKDFYFAKC